MNAGFTNALEQVKGRRFVVASIDAEGYFSLAARPFFHPTASLAQAEADRLAQKDSNKVFIVMGIMGGSKAVVLQRI